MLNKIFFILVKDIQEDEDDQYLGIYIEPLYDIISRFVKLGHTAVYYSMLFMIHKKMADYYFRTSWFKGEYDM
jgi:hypothetical protein